MATKFMKWLETSPKDYDRSIRILTLGRPSVCMLREDRNRCADASANSIGYGY